MIQTFRLDQNKVSPPRSNQKLVKLTNQKPRHSPPGWRLCSSFLATPPRFWQSGRDEASGDAAMRVQCNLVQCPVLDWLLLVYIITISPRGSNKFLRVFRRYSDFKLVRQELLDQVGLHLMLSTANVVFTWHGPFDNETDVQFPLPRVLALRRCVRKTSMLNPGTNSRPRFWQLGFWITNWHDHLRILFVWLQMWWARKMVMVNYRCVWVFKSRHFGQHWFYEISDAWRKCGSEWVPANQTHPKKAGKPSVNLENCETQQPSY